MKTMTAIEDGCQAAGVAMMSSMEMSREVVRERDAREEKMLHDLSCLVYFLVSRGESISFPER